MTRPLMEGFARLPRVTKWIVWSGVFVAAFLVVDSVFLTMYDRWTLRADRLESQLARLRSLAESDSDDGKVIEIGMSNFGQPRLPVDSAKAAALLTQRVNAIFDAAGLDDRNQIEKTSTLQIPQALRSETTFEKLDRIIVEVTFEAEPETLAQILADLESSADISAVSRVRIDRGSGAGSSRNSERSPSRVVRATIAAETWAIPERTGGRSGAGGAS